MLATSLEFDNDDDNLSHDDLRGEGSHGSPRGKRMENLQAPAAAERTDRWRAHHTEIA